MYIYLHVKIQNLEQQPIRHWLLARHWKVSILEGCSPIKLWKLFPKFLLKVGVTLLAKTSIRHYMDLCRATRSMSSASIFGLNLEWGRNDHLKRDFYSCSWKCASSPLTRRFKLLTPVLLCINWDTMHARQFYKGIHLLKESSGESINNHLSIIPALGCPGSIPKVVSWRDYKITHLIEEMISAVRVLHIMPALFWA